MKVAELIAALQKYPADADVEYFWSEIDAYGDDCENQSSVDRVRFEREKVVLE